MIYALAVATMFRGAAHATGAVDALESYAKGPVGGGWRRGWVNSHGSHCDRTREGLRDFHHKTPRAEAEADGAFLEVRMGIRDIQRTHEA